MDDTRMIKIGPAGAAFVSMYSPRKEWDHRGRTQIAQIFISYGRDRIYSIQFQYVENETLVLSELYGIRYGPKFSTVSFNHPSEYITSINGYHCSGKDAITSLTFDTNQGKYGPFGSPSGVIQESEFQFQLGPNRQFGGFYGVTENACLKSIGVYLDPVTTLGPPVKEEERA